MRAPRTFQRRGGFCGASLLAFCILACSEPAGLPPPPDHEVVKVEEPSFGSVRRLVYRIRLPEHYPRATVEAIARWTVAELREQGQAVNAVSMLFYGPNTSTSGAYDVASIDWAPGGEWSSADTVRAGDYSTFRFSVSYNEPRAESARLLSASGDTGLFDIPLPEGARLIERVAGDKDAGVDPRERYEISASAAEIVTFFASEMPRAGWKKTGPASQFALFFERRGIMVGVLTNQDGGTFTLMGS